MADTFGLNGYMCDVAPVDGGYVYSARDAKFPDIVKTLEVKGEDLIPGLSATDRAQAESVMAPLFAELDAAREERIEEEEKASAERRAAARTSARERTAEREANTAPANVTPVADDGTYPNMNVQDVTDGEGRDPNGKGLKTGSIKNPDGSTSKVAVGTPTSKGNDQYANPSALTDAKATGRQIVENDANKGDSSAT